MEWLDGSRFTLLALRKRGEAPPPAPGCEVRSCAFCGRATWVDAANLHYVDDDRAELGCEECLTGDAAAGVNGMTPEGQQKLLAAGWEADSLAFAVRRLPVVLEARARDRATARTEARRRAQVRARA